MCLYISNKPPKACKPLLIMVNGKPREMGGKKEKNG